jgi:16S rRNA (cytosine1402-N4)-methyltransferase
MHKAVLLKETIDGLDLRPGDIYLDGTLGNGGHALEASRRLPGKITVIGLDLDSHTLRKVEEKFEKEGGKAHFKAENFRNLDKVLKDLHLEKVDRIIFDLGLSSEGLENSGRGFSFKSDEPLLMTFKDKPTEEDLTAEDVVNNFSEESLAQIIYGYGEERYSRRIAKHITEARKQKLIKTTSDLVEIIRQAVPRNYLHQKTHFATRTFQAIRMAVNDELGALQDGLRKGFDHLESGGRFAVISFHSLEDRIVKRFFNKLAKSGEARLVAKKPIVPSREEIMDNPRARSAKLRIIEKI